MTHWAGRCEAMWVTISHGSDNKPLASAEGEGLTSAEDEWPGSGRLKAVLDQYDLLINLISYGDINSHLIKAQRKVLPLQVRHRSFTARSFHRVRRWSILVSPCLCFMQVNPDLRHHLLSSQHKTTNVNSDTVSKHYFKLPLLFVLLAVCVSVHKT